MMTRGEGVEVHRGIVEVGGWEEEGLFVIDTEMTGYDTVDEMNERGVELESLVAKTMMKKDSVCVESCVRLIMEMTQLLSKMSSLQGC